MSVIRDYLLLRKVKQKKPNDQQRSQEECDLLTKNMTSNVHVDQCDHHSAPTSPKRSSVSSTMAKKLNLLTLTNLSSTLLKRPSVFKHNFYMNLNHERRPRLVKKCGELNIDVESVPKRKRRLLSDFFNTVLDVKWRWHIIIFIMTFLISWIVFASVWYLIAYLHGDLAFNAPSSQTSHDVTTQHHHTQKSFLLNTTLDQLDDLTHSLLNLDRLLKSPSKTYESKLDEFNALFNLSDFKLRNLTQHLKSIKEENSHDRHVPCVHGIHDFTSALLYSVETQHTIGYGLRHITEECPLAILFLMLQSCFGIFVQGLVAGVVFAKISRPNKRKRTIIFSHNAVVSERDGRLVFMFKIGNVRISQLSDAKLRMLMVKSRVTSDGEFIPFQTYNMKVGYDWSGNESVFFPWPKTVEHVIDSSSPFYEICKQVIENQRKTSGDVDSDHSPDTTTNQQETETTVFTDTTETGPKKSTLSMTRNIDYEIVVMLEGNIETTGASCHIRTSYLPQEILFGYRFVPIYPKFNKFEYMFDFSKFDQVEPVQPHLFHLNCDTHFNKTVYDAKKEMKNCQLTYQNTILNDQHQDSDNNRPVSLLTILNAFKDHEKAAKEIDRNKDTIDEEANVTVLEMDEVDGGVQKGDDSAKSPRPLANGRFTVVPVAEKLIMARKKPILKRIGTVTPTKLNSPRTHRLGRANSTPPVFIFCQPVDGGATHGSSVSSSVEDEGYPSSFKLGYDSTTKENIDV